MVMIVHVIKINQQKHWENVPEVSYYKNYYNDVAKRKQKVILEM